MSSQPEALPAVAWRYRSEDPFDAGDWLVVDYDPTRWRKTVEALTTLAAASARIAELEQQLAHVKREAGVWKMEARTQKATVDATGAELGGIPDYGPIAASVRALRERAEAAEQQLAQAQKDARRYQWLRDDPRGRALSMGALDWTGDQQKADDAIDAALSSSAEESNG